VVAAICAVDALLETVVALTAVNAVAVFTAGVTVKMAAFAVLIAVVAGMALICATPAKEVFVVAA
jgi:hypothetical protein